MARWKLVSTVRGWFASEERPETPAVEAVLTRNAESFMRMKGVLSVGVGRTSDGRPAVVLGLADPMAASVRDLPTEVEGVPVIHREIGRPEARKEPTTRAPVESSEAPDEPADSPPEP